MVLNWCYKSVRSYYCRDESMTISQSSGKRHFHWNINREWIKVISHHSTDKGPYKQFELRKSRYRIPGQTEDKSIGMNTESCRFSGLYINSGKKDFNPCSFQYCRNEVEITHRNATGYQNNVTFCDCLFYNLVRCLFIIFSYSIILSQRSGTK